MSAHAAAADGWLASEGVSGFSTFPPKEFGTFAIEA
jgi:hypothetical protein